VLGPNGAGKTTLVKLLLGITAADSGGGRVLGFPIGDVHAREAIGYLPELHQFPSYLTPPVALGYFARLSGISQPRRATQIRELIELVGLTDSAKRRIRGFSKGMMQRVALAQAMLGEPNLLFLDEPTDGLDPIGRRQVREILLQLRAQGASILLNSHLLGEAELVADRVAILNAGRIVRAGTMREVTEGGGWIVRFEDDATATRAATLIRERNVEAIGSGSSVNLPGIELAGANGVLDQLRGAGIAIAGLERRHISLEDYFIRSIASEQGAVNS
jgi:ABC-2 type transport system ATP-binding protein